MSETIEAPDRTSREIVEWVGANMPGLDLSGYDRPVTALFERLALQDVELGTYRSLLDIEEKSLADEIRAMVVSGVPDEELALRAGLIVVGWLGADDDDGPEKSARRAPREH